MLHHGTPKQQVKVGGGHALDGENSLGARVAAMAASIKEAEQAYIETAVAEEVATGGAGPAGLSSVVVPAGGGLTVNRLPHQLDITFWDETKVQKRSSCSPFLVVSPSKAGSVSPFSRSVCCWSRSFCRLVATVAGHWRT